MRKYELMVILDPDLDERTIAPSLDQFLTVVRSGGGTVDKVEGDRIKLTKKDSAADVQEGQGAHAGHHHYISTGLVAGVEGDKVRLSANADVAVTFEEEESAG